MKPLKMLGLTALAALMAMAFVGASSAMAESTALCKVDESPCAVANLSKEVHETSVGKAKLLTSVGTTECNVLFSGMVEKEGSPLVVKGGFTYTNCVLGAVTCSATEENGPAEVSVLKEGHETAKVTGEGLVHVVCAGFIDCSYTGAGLVGTAKGPLLSAQTPDNGEVSLSEQSVAKEAGGLLCPKTAKLDITTTPLTATYISTPPPMKCENVGGTSGLYLGAIDGTECKAGHSTPLGSFELVGA